PLEFGIRARKGRNGSFLHRGITKGNSDRMMPQQIVKSDVFSQVLLIFRRSADKKKDPDSAL
ncbi:MAG: hypothetical protein RR320_04095, partial [Oscillospiraceae bacterium]